MDDARLGRERGELHGGGRRRKIDDAVGVDEQRQRIVADGHAEGGQAGQNPGSSSSSGAPPLQRAGERNARIRRSF